MPDATAIPLVEMFDRHTRVHDLRAGTARSANGDREIYLSTDVLRGIHEALTYEAGDAWGVVLHRCGQIWGERVTERLWRDAKMRSGKTPDDFKVDGFLGWVREWFRMSGWGDTVFDLRDAESNGVVWVRLHFSLFREALDPCPERADFLVAGLLGAFFTKVAGRPLAAVELPPDPDDDAVLFAISGPDRIESLSDEIEDGMGREDACKVLLGV